MQAETYELIALGMRYWFSLLGILMVYRAVRWAWHEHRQYMHTMASLPDAGLIGELVDMDSGQAYPLAREGVLGSGRACDIRIPGLRVREVEFILKEGTGVHLIPCHMKHQLLIDGEALHHGGFALHGSRLSLPGRFMRFRLFAGLDVPAVHHQQTTPSYQEGTEDDGGFDMSALGQYDAFRQIEESLPTQVPAEQPLDMDMTWVYAIPPAGDVHLGDPRDTQEGASPAFPEQQPEQAVSRRRRRRGD